MSQLKENEDDNDYEDENEYEDEDEIKKYKELICKHVQTIVSNHINLKPVKIDETNFTVKIMFIPPEWFLELDDDLQYDIQYNLSLFCKENYEAIKKRAHDAIK